MTTKQMFRKGRKKIYILGVRHQGTFHHIKLWWWSIVTASFFSSKFICITSAIKNERRSTNTVTSPLKAPANILITLLQTCSYIMHSYIQATAKKETNLETTFNAVKSFPSFLFTPQNTLDTHQPLLQSSWDILNFPPYTSIKMITHYHKAQEHIWKATSWGGIS